MRIGRVISFTDCVCGISLLMGWLKLLENSSKPCDTGSPIASIAPSFPAFTYTTVSPLYPDKTSPAAAAFWYTRAAILARGRRCLEALRARPEKFVFVVSHSGFLRLGMTGWWWFNSDYRVFDFVGDAGGVEVRQRDETLEGGMGLSWTHRVELGIHLPEEPEEDPVEEEKKEEGDKNDEVEW